MPAKKLAIATHKGGTGKTVSAMNLAAAFARAGKRTLLVDLDPQGHSGMGLGVELEDGAFTLRDLFTEPPQAIGKLVRKTYLDGLDLIPSDVRLAWVAEAITGRPKREEILKRRLEPVLGEYEWVLLDCPPSLGVLTQNAIAAADQVLIPCLIEARAQDALVDLLELLRVLRGEGFESWSIVLTKVDKRKTVTAEAVMATLKPWEGRILGISIPQSEPLNQAQIARRDIFEFDPKSPGALAYRALADEILSHGSN